jgi:hypothetical protein
MGAFDHVLLLLSFVFAMALTHLLSRVGALMFTRKPVRFSGLQTLEIVNAIVWLYANWLALWYLRGIKDWELLSITTWFAYAIQNYFACAAAAPEVGEGGAFDMEAFYWDNRRNFWGVMLVGAVLTILTNFTFVSDRALFLEANVYTLPFFVPCILALTVRARWAQWTSGLLFLAIDLTLLLTFSSALK